MRALIDGDILLYNSAFAVQRKIYTFVSHDKKTRIEFTQGTTMTDIKRDFKHLKGTGVLKSTLRLQPEAFACEAAKRMVNAIMHHTGADEYTLYLTAIGRSGYRYDLLPEYKAGRPSKPHYYQVVRDYLVKAWGAIDSEDGLEADDMLGLKQTDDTIICSIDKDLHMIPGKHYNISTKEMREVTEFGEVHIEELPNKRKKIVGGGLVWFYAQLLLGDTADNIPGINGYGPVKVCKLLKDKKTELELYEVVEKVYKKQHPQDYLERIHLVGQLLWIQRPGRRQWKIPKQT